MRKSGPLRSREQEGKVRVVETCASLLLGERESGQEPARLEPLDRGRVESQACCDLVWLWLHRLSTR